MKKSPNYLYFIGSEKHIKIGVTSNPDNRIKSVRTGCPVLCDYLAIFECGEKARHYEKKIHDIFAKYCSHGEWFFAHNDILSFIKNSKNLGCLKCDMWEKKFNSVYYVIDDNFVKAQSIDISKYIKTLKTYKEKINQAA